MLEPDDLCRLSPGGRHTAFVADSTLGLGDTLADAPAWPWCSDLVWSEITTLLRHLAGVTDRL